MEPETYWLGVLLDTWPTARIDTPDYNFPQIEVPESYMAARHAQEVVPYLWVLADDDLVIDADDAQSTHAADLQMVAHVRPSTPLQPGTRFQLDTLWVIRGPVPDDYVATLSLVDGRDNVVAQANHSLVSGWSGTTTSQWPPNQFHDVALSLDLPDELTQGPYTLRLDVSAQSDGTKPSPEHDSACDPGCHLIVGEIAIIRANS